VKCWPDRSYRRFCNCPYILYGFLVMYFHLYRYHLVISSWSRSHSRPPPAQVGADSRHSQPSAIVGAISSQYTRGLFSDRLKLIGRRHLICFASRMSLCRLLQNRATKRKVAPCLQYPRYAICGCYGVDGMTMDRAKAGEASTKQDALETRSSWVRLTSGRKMIDTDVHHRCIWCGSPFAHVMQS
jgi:hypothetical protein